MRTKYFKDRFPIWQIAADHIISNKGATTAAFLLVKPDIFTLSAEQLDRWYNTWVKVLDILPPDIILHMQDWYWQSRWKGRFEGQHEDILSISSERYHHERPWLQHRCYLFVSHRPERSARNAGSTLVRQHFVPQDTLSPEAIQSFNALVSQIVQLFTGSGLMDCRRLSTEELVGSKGEAGIIEQYCQLNMPGDIPLVRDLDFEQGIRIGAHQCLLHTLADAAHLPPQVGPGRTYAPYTTEQTPFPTGFASPLGLLLPCNHIYNQYIFTEDQGKVRKKLEQTRQRMLSLSAHSRENTLNAADIGALLDESIADGKKIVRVHFNVFSWTADPAGQNRLNDQVAAAIAKMGATPYQESIIAPLTWAAGIPGNAADLLQEESYHILADRAVCMLIPDSTYKDNIGDAGVRLGTRIDGVPVQVDLSDAPVRSGLITNRNKFILGGSGSGKSFFTNHLVRSCFNQGAHITIVDIGNSYHGLCRMLGGYYFTYRESSPLRLNPFWYPKGEPPDTEKWESLKSMLHALWKKEDEFFIRSEYVALSHALRLYYEKLQRQPEIFPCFDSFYEYLRDEFIGVLLQDKVQRKDFDIGNFLYVLRPFYRGGEFDFLLNATEQLDLRAQRFIVFELDTIKDHPILFPIVTLVIMEVFIGKMRHLPGIRKIMLIEEAWKAIARQGMSEYIKYLFKTVRKHYGEAIVVTQEVEDILSSPIVKQAILNNADCKILLDQSKFRNRFDELKQILGLTEMDKALVLSLNQQLDPERKYKEVFISLGTGCSRVYRVEVSLEEYLCYTTEEREKVQVEEWARKYGGMRDGITALAASIRDGSVKWLLVTVMLLLGLLAPTRHANAQFAITEIINMGVKKVIVATDLAVQRLQTKTIGLQNAQKTLENAMQLRQLTDITDWLQQQKDLFAGYYDELWQVKEALKGYHRIKELVNVGSQFGMDVTKVLSSLRRDPHFSPEEMTQISAVYDRMLDQVIRITAELTNVSTGYVAQMEDGDRLEIIDMLGEDLDQQAKRLARLYTGQHPAEPAEKQEPAGDKTYTNII